MIDVEVDPMERLVTLMHARFIKGGFYQHHHILAITGETVELIELPEEMHPIEAIVQIGELEKKFDALGLVAFGWASSLSAENESRPSEESDRQRVIVTTVMTRRGTTHATATMEDGQVIDDSGSGGVNDALSWALGIDEEGGRDEQ